MAGAPAMWAGGCHQGSVPYPRMPEDMRRGWTDDPEMPEDEIPRVCGGIIFII